MDELVSWGAEFGTHICIDVHCSFGFTTDEEVYAYLMRWAMNRIRAYTPDRLIFVDMLNIARDPVYSLAKDKVAQSFHFYEPGALTGAGLNDDFDGAYLVFTGKGYPTKPGSPLCCRNLAYITQHLTVRPWNT